ncbi:MAG TPA: helix-turn-helix transcriptional regulator [Candidatus Paceibacterota bacterium]
MSKRKLVKFGRILQEARLSSKTPMQSDAASKLGCTQSMLSQYESGTISNPTAELLRSFATAYGIDYAGLVASFVKDKFGVSFSSDKLTALKTKLAKRNTKNVLQRIG